MEYIKLVKSRCCCKQTIVCFPLTLYGQHSVPFPPEKEMEAGGDGGRGGGRGPPFRRTSNELSTGPTIKHFRNAIPYSLRTHSSVAPADQNETPPPPPPPPLDSSSSFSSASLIGHNEDILLQIFPFLPPKSLLRFQAVSKQWLIIISNPSFRRLHLRVNPTTATSALLLFRKIDGRAPELNFISRRIDCVISLGNIVFKLNHLFDNADILNLHCCNGLLCIKFNFDYDVIEFVVYNPTTNQRTLIPGLREIVEDRLLQTSIVNIAFDPSKPSHYKLVCILTDKFEAEYRFIVYSSETGVWRVTATTLDIDIQHPYFDRGVLWNGDLHWATEWGYTLCFDLDNERLRLITPYLPPGYERDYEVCYFGNSGDQLCLMNRGRPQPMVFNVFTLKTDYPEWTLKCSIDISHLSTFYPTVIDEDNDPQEFDFHMLHYLADEKEKNSMLVLSTHGFVISFDVDAMTVKELAEVDPKEVSYQWLEPCRYSWRDAARYIWREAYPHFETFAYV